MPRNTTQRKFSPSTNQYKQRHKSRNSIIILHIIRQHNNGHFLLHKQKDTLPVVSSRTNETTRTSDNIIVGTAFPDTFPQDVSGCGIQDGYKAIFIVPGRQSIARTTPFRRANHNDDGRFFIHLFVQNAPEVDSGWWICRGWS